MREQRSIDLRRRRGCCCAQRCRVLRRGGHLFDLRHWLRDVRFWPIGVDQTTLPRLRSMAHCGRRPSTVCNQAWSRRPLASVEQSATWAGGLDAADPARAHGLHRAQPGLLGGADGQADEAGGLLDLSQTLRQQVGLFGELCRALAFQLGQVLQLPANARQMLGMRDAQQRPFGLTVDE